VSLGAAVTNVPFALATKPAPGNWFFSALPLQNQTGGSVPGDPFVKFLRVVDLPSPWTVSDLGAPAIPAYSAESAGSFTLVSAGTNVAGVADQGEMLSAAIGGDVQITARLVSLTSTGTTARAGLMLRDGISAGARGVFLLAGMQSSNTAAFMVRSQAQSAVSSLSAMLPAGPVWLRAVRFGNSISCYTSTNGTTWLLCGSSTVSMNSAIQAGLAVVSGTADIAARAVFQNVLIEPLGAGFAEWQSWVFGARGVTNANVIAPNADADGDGRSNLAEFYLGSDPLQADDSTSASVAGITNSSVIRLRFVERKNAADLGRQFWQSPDLKAWSVVSPASVTDIEDMGSLVVREVTFPVSASAGFYRASYAPWPSGG
jgi:hypothetical protein